MSQAVICDECGKVIRLRDACIVDILRTKTDTIYSGHLCNKCIDKYRSEKSGMEIMMTRKPPEKLQEKYKYRIK